MQRIGGTNQVFSQLEILATHSLTTLETEPDSGRIRSKAVRGEKKISA